MQRFILCSCSLILSVLCLLSVYWASQSNSNSPKVMGFGFGNGHYNIIDKMPLILDDPLEIFASGVAPIEQRGIEFRKWLSPGLKISVSRASGSGTIIYYDHSNGWAYVQSCGHLWSGNMSAEEGRRRQVKCKVITWYHNEKKLSSTKSYEAEVLYYSNTRTKDCSLLRFKPDWVPNYFPIAPEEFDFKQDMRLHSVGCDGGREVAHYDVRYIGMRSGDIVTTENSPRPGRSGGGLMSNDGYYVGICWGTSDYSGNGNGYFTPLTTLRELNEREGFGWLNEIGHNLARKIPIVDRNNPQGKYPRDYIPLPGGQ